jgi:hypothetical protein
MVVVMTLLRALPLVALLFAGPSFADDSGNGFDGLLQETWTASELTAAIQQELGELDGRRSAAIAAYNDLGAKLAVYNGWCNTYGITALRKVVEGRLYGRLFSYVAFPFYHVYNNDPHFQGYRDRLDKAMDKMRTTSIDVGKCALTEDMMIRLRRDPKQFEPKQDETQASFAYAMLAGNMRLIEEEKQILLELKGVIAGAREKDNDPVVEEFITKNFGRLIGKVELLRARTLDDYEFGFRIPLGALEEYWGKKIGHGETDDIPNFFWIFERRTYYVNQARLAAGKFFDTSVRNYTKAEVLQNRFLRIVREASARN